MVHRVASQKQWHPRRCVARVVVCGLACILLGVLTACVGGTGNAPTVPTTPTIQAAAITGVSAVHTAVSTVTAAQTATAEAQNPNPYSGTLVISDPLSKPGSAFGWATGNDGHGDECDFKNGAYHVYGTCGAFDLSKTSRLTTFAFEVRFIAGDNCGGIAFGTGSGFFNLHVCQDGQYNIHAKSTVSGIASVIHTEVDQSNIIGVVSDGVNVTLFINDVRILSTPGVYTGLPHPFLFGSKTVGGPEAAGGSADVIYTDARLWSL